MKKLPPEGLWIEPRKKRGRYPWVPVVEHLITIQHHPTKFGLEPADVMGASIEDLRRIAVALIGAGWVRYRHFGDSQNFELRSARDQIDVVEDVLSRIGAYGEERVFISQLTPKKEFVGTVNDVFDRKILRFQENPRKNRWRLS